MGYFSNGTAGTDYEETYCRKCAHFGPEDGPGCPIWAAHLLYAYALCNEEKHPGKVMLDMFIPRSDGGGNGRCVMFVPASRLNASKRNEQDKAELERLLARCTEILKEAKSS